MIIRKATQKDLDYIRTKPFEKAVKNYPYMEILDSNCYTAEYNGEIVGIGGIQVIWEGRGYCWLILPEDFKKSDMFGIIAIRTLKSMIDKLVADNNLKRIEAVIRADFPVGEKMVKFFGFEKECLMRKYFPDGCDGYLYARIL